MGNDGDGNDDVEIGMGSEMEKNNVEGETKNDMAMGS